jgi:hypothetical protein
MLSLTHLFLLLYLQMDQLKDRQFINPDTLQKGIPYFIRQVKQIMTVDCPELIARLRFNGQQDVWFVLPQHFTFRLDENLLRFLNSRRYVFDLVYRGRTRYGTPIF